MSFPLPPCSVTGSGASDQVVVSVSAVDRRRDGVGEDAVALVDAHDVVAVPAVDGDLCDLRPREGEVGRAVVSDVDLQHRRIAGLQAKREPVVPIGSLDRQLALRELRIVERRLVPQLRRLVGMVGGRGAVSGRGPCRAADGGDRGHCRDRQQRRPHCTRVVESNEVPHGFLSEWIDLSSVGDTGERRLFPRGER